jgi:flagellar hook-basal body complex protein FliE
MQIEQLLSALGNGSSPLNGEMAKSGGLQAPGTGSAAGTAFGDSLQRLVTAVESSGAQANDSILKMTDGTGDVHDAMIALQRADLTLQLTVQIRNKLVNAYQEIMRMPV